MNWLWLSAATMVAVAFVHAVLGERRLIGPQLAAADGVLARPLARTVTRFAWHLTSVLMILSALTVAWPGTAPALVAIIGAVWAACGIFDGIATRGQHVGWPFLTAAGVFALIGSIG